MRLIDADALKKVFHAEWDDVLVWDESGEITADQFCNIVDAAPTIEADIKCEDCKTIIALKAALEPVKHGRWIKISDRNYKCSACGDWWSGEGKEIKTLLYCPNCGAKMEPIPASPENGQEVEA